MSKYFTKAGQTVIGGIDPNDEPRFAKIVYQNRGLLTLDPILAATFQGKQFFFSDAFTLAATSDHKNFVFQTPNSTKWAHLVWRGTGSAITTFEVIEDTMLTTSDFTSTDSLTVFNNNRNSTATADCRIWPVDDTVDYSTDSGTTIFEIASGAATNQSRTPASGTYADEVFLKSNTMYRFSFSTGSASNLCNILLQWHEHTNES